MFPAGWAERRKFIAGPSATVATTSACHDRNASVRILLGAQRQRAGRVGRSWALATTSRSRSGARGVRGASNTEDDLAIITTGTNGTPYRSDDAGNTTGTATAATVAGTALSAVGVIERTSDVDVWSFASGAGPVSFTFTPWVNSPNLDIRAELRDSSGNVLATHSPVANLNASISFTLPAQGTYYVTVEGSATAP